MGIKLNWDAAGIVTSIACAIHCALLPVLLTSLPVFGIDIIQNSYFEWGMIALAFFIGCYALYHGYIKHHKSLLPFGLFAVGFILLVFKQFLHRYEYWLLAVAVALIVSAHYINYRRCHRSKCSSPHHTH
jgi:hypothetical protein